MLGHTNVKTTQVYAKVIDEKKNKAAEAIQLKSLKNQSEKIKYFEYIAIWLSVFLAFIHGKNC